MLVMLRHIVLVIGRVKDWCCHCYANIPANMPSEIFLFSRNLNKFLILPQISVAFQPNVPPQANIQSDRPHSQQQESHLWVFNTIEFTLTQGKDLKEITALSERIMEYDRLTLLAQYSHIIHCHHRYCEYKHPAHQPF